MRLHVALLVDNMAPVITLTKENEHKEKNEKKVVEEKEKNEEKQLQEEN